MQRAAILIGVSKTGNLRQLQAATAGVRAMERWALSQGMDRDLVKVLTDEAGRVDVQQIKDAIDEIVELATVEQLIVYFAGHGVNIRYGEYWLLSRAPNDTQAAVNVAGSVVLAQYCGIPHVVLISDACRTAAEGIQAQHVTGSEVFPNTGGGGVEQSVDLFFGCTLGKPALEIKDPGAAAEAYEAVYTSALVEILEGKHEQVLERTQVDGETFGLVRPRPLKRYLSTVVAGRLASPHVQPGITQTPDARITSDEEAWLARVSLPASARGRAARRGRMPSFSVGPEIAPPETLFSMSQALLRGALTGSAESAVPQEVSGGDLLARSMQHTAASFGPTHFETGCGFKVRGAQIIDAYSRQARAELLGASGEILRIHDIAPPAANVLLIFDGGSGAVLPAIPDFVAALTFEDGELANVTYEPSDRSWRWSELGAKLEELRSLRSVIASSAQLGVFRLEGNQAPELAQRMQYAKGIDPTMALYAAYAYHDLQRRDKINEMQAYMKADLGLRLFDIALLARGLDGQRAGAVKDVFPFVPLLSQGWALLKAYGASLPASLAGIERHLLPSLWSLFDSAGVAMVRAAMHAQEVR